MRDIVISEADAESRPAVAQEAAGASEPRTVDALALPRWDHAAQELLLLNQKAPKLASIRRRAAAAATAAVDATAAAISEAVAAAQDSDAPIVVRQTMPDDPAVAAAVTASEPTRDAARLLELVPAADREFAARPDLARKVALWTGDVTRLRIECVVNATNPTLSPGGGGLNSTLHMRAGADMAQELQHVVGAEQLQPGDVVRTGGHGLPCRAVLHVLPPRFGQPDTDVTLGECCTAVLQAAVRFGCVCRCAVCACLRLRQAHARHRTPRSFREIALPCLGTGHYGHPADLAAVQSLGAVRVWLEENSELVDLLVLCTRTPDNHVLYEQLMPVYFPTVPPIDVSDASAGASRYLVARAAHHCIAMPPSYLQQCPPRAAPHAQAQRHRAHPPTHRVSKRGCASRRSHGHRCRLGWL